MTDVHTMPAGNGRRLRSGSYRRTRRKTCFGCRPGDSHGWLLCELTLEAAQRHKRLQDLKKGYLTTNTTKQSPALPNRTVLEHRGTHSGTAAAREALSLASGPETEPSRTHAQAQALAHTHTPQSPDAQDHMTRMWSGLLAHFSKGKSGVVSPSCSGGVLYTPIWSAMALF